jgi:hypothetical protein
VHCVAKSLQRILIFVNWSVGLTNATYIKPTRGQKTFFPSLILEDHHFHCLQTTTGTYVAVSYAIFSCSVVSNVDAGIILTRTRVVVSRLVDFIRELPELKDKVFPERFVGQGEMTDVQQDNALKQFRLRKKLSNLFC